MSPREIDHHQKSLVTLLPSTLYSLTHTKLRGSPNITKLKMSDVEDRPESPVEAAEEVEVSNEASKGQSTFTTKWD